MSRSTGLQSLFSQQLDRAVFATYFLGAVVPLAALALISQRYALPALAGEAYGPAGLAGLVSGVACLCLAGYLALRRLTLGAVARMKSDNERLTALLEISRELSFARHGDEVAGPVAQCAIALSGARAALVMLRSGPDKPLALAHWAGDGADEIHRAYAEPIDELVEAALRDGRPTVLDSGCLAASDTEESLSAAVALPMGADGGSAGALVVLQLGAVGAFSPAQTGAVETLTALASVALDNADLHGTQRNFFAHVTEMIVAALDAHVRERRGHAKQVAQLANRVGREMGLEQGRLQTLHFASLLHDLGMLKIEPASQLDPVHYQKHPMLGHRMLSQIRLWRDVAPIVLHHHERYDGTGYPHGLSGHDIPLEARIIAVVESFDAMGRNHERRRPLSAELALREIRDCSGTQFDPEVVAHFLRLAERGELGL